MITQDYIFTFGKNKDCTLKSMTLFQDDINYIYWCAVNIKWFKFPTNKQLEELKKVSNIEEWYEHLTKNINEYLPNANPLDFKYTPKEKFKESDRYDYKPPSGGAYYPKNKIFNSKEMHEYQQITRYWTDEEKKEYYPHQYYQEQKENYEQELDRLKHIDYINTYGEFTQVD